MGDRDGFYREKVCVRLMIIETKSLHQAVSASEMSVNIYQRIRCNTLKTAIFNELLYFLQSLQVKPGIENLNGQL
jgi:hypothetical protein